MEKRRFRYDLPVEIYNMLVEIAEKRHTTLIGTVKQLIIAAHADLKNA